MFSSVRDSPPAPACPLRVLTACRCPSASRQLVRPRSCDSAPSSRLTDSTGKSVYICALRPSLLPDPRFRSRVPHTARRSAEKKPGRNRSRRARFTSFMRSEFVHISMNIFGGKSRKIGHPEHGKYTVVFTVYARFMQDFRLIVTIFCQRTIQKRNFV